MGALEAAAMNRLCHWEDHLGWHAAFVEPKTLPTRVTSWRPGAPRAAYGDGGSARAQCARRTRGVWYLLIDLARWPSVRHTWMISWTLITISSWRNAFSKDLRYFFHQARSNRLIITSIMIMSSRLVEPSDVHKPCAGERAWVVSPPKRRTNSRWSFE